MFTGIILPLLVPLLPSLAATFHRLFSGIFHKVLPLLRDCESTDFQPVFLGKSSFLPLCNIFLLFVDNGFSVFWKCF